MEDVREPIGFQVVYSEHVPGGAATGAMRLGIDSLVRKGLDGFIISPSSDPDDPHDPIVEILRKELPLVLVDKRLPGVQANLVCVHSQLGAEILTEHLIELRHRRIGFIGTGGVSTVEDRVRGFNLIMQRRGLPVQREWIATVPSVYRDYGREQARLMLTAPADLRPRAIIGANDPIAQTIADVAREIGLRVPDDLSVVGFDDAGFEADEVRWLTTYARPTYQIGRQAAQLLMRHIEQPDLQPETVLLEGRLIIRSSTGPSPQNVRLRPFDSSRWG